MPTVHRLLFFFFLMLIGALPLAAQSDQNNGAGQEAQTRASAPPLPAPDDSTPRNPSAPPPQLAPDPPLSANAIVDQVFYRENKLVESMHNYSPMVETYIQNLRPDAVLGSVPKSDQYFVGRLILDKRGIGQKSYQAQPGVPSRILDSLNHVYKMNYVPLGFMQMVILDTGFDRKNYDLKFLRREFLGEVRCLVFDVTAKPKAKGPHFLGRIWVEDQGYSIVRFNGSYVPQQRSRFFFHFDSWRMNVRPGLWLPSYIYFEESDARYAMFRKLMMKSQTRLWGYDLKHSGRQEELTSIVVDAPPASVLDHSGAPNEIVPIQSQHMWEREAEDNVLERLERAGVLAPDGEVSKVMQTVVNNLEVTNNLDVQPEVRCRVLLTTPLESFTIGHTIVVSRGLLDVLPDEASLAMVLAHELGHIALGHRLDTKYAFSDRMLFPDEQTFRRIALVRNGSEEVAADQKGLEFLKKSPYNDKLANAGLFLRALESRQRELTWLVSPHFGNRMTKGNGVLRMAVLKQSAPQLQIKDMNQIAALPLGSRIKLDPWDDHVEMQKSKGVPLLSARDKMSFEVTPMFPNLARYPTSEEVAATVGK